MSHEINFKPLITAGTILGIGIGGFFDGILFHQMLQLHHMLSNRLSPDTLINVEINMFWDGLFHAFVWIMTLIGISLLWKAIRRSDVPKSTKTLLGSILFGWGLFNFVEGVIDHQILQVHHVVQRASRPAQLYWDLIFLASGIALIVLGRVLIMRGRTRDMVSEL